MLAHESKCGGQGRITTSRALGCAIPFAGKQLEEPGNGPPVTDGMRTVPVMLDFRRSSWRVEGSFIVGIGFGPLVGGLQREGATERIL